MEGRIKRYKIHTTVSVSWLNLHQWIPQRDIRKLIYRLLDSVDWQIVQFAHTGKGLKTDRFMGDCAWRGYFDLIKWGLTQKLKIDSRVSHRAAKSGNLEILQWLEDGGHNTKCLCAISATYGQLKVLKWCRRNHYPWDHWTCLYAAKYGHLSVLQWAFENGCTMYPSIRLITKHQHIIDWIDSVRFP